MPLAPLPTFASTVALYADAACCTESEARFRLLTLPHDAMRRSVRFAAIARSLGVDRDALVDALVAARAQLSPAPGLRRDRPTSDGIPS